MTNNAPWYRNSVWIRALFGVLLGLLAVASLDLVFALKDGRAGRAALDAFLALVFGGLFILTIKPWLQARRSEGSDTWSDWPDISPPDQSP